MADTSASPDKKSSSSSLEGFAGFHQKEITNKKLPILNSFSEQTMRVSQPRTSKSRASLVWKKEEKRASTVKEAPKEKITDTKKFKKVVINHNGTNDLRKRINKNVSVKQKKIQNITTANAEQTPSSPVKQKQPQNITTEETEQTPSSSLTSPENTQLSGNLAPAMKKKRRSRKYERINGFKCDQCGKKYKYYRGMQQHQKLECNKDPQFPCPYCPSKYRYRQNIREHVRSCHELAFPKWYATHYVVPHIKKLQSKK